MNKYEDKKIIENMAGSINALTSKIIDIEEKLRKQDKKIKELINEKTEEK